MDELSPTSATDQSSFHVPKRIRVSQACEQCRSKKGKCDGQQPACSVCRSLNLPCSYNPHPKKRGLRPGHYALLERRAVLAELITAYLVKCIPDADAKLASFFEFEDPTLPFLAGESSKQAELVRDLKDWRSSAAGAWVSEVSARSDASVDQLSIFRSQHASSGLSSQAASGAQSDAGVSTFRRQDVKLSRTQRSEATEDGNNSNSRSAITTAPPAPTTVYELPKNMESIFDTYFAYTHTWLPLVDKFKLMAFYHTFSSRQNMPLSKLSHDQAGSLALLWSFIAYASLYEPESGAKEKASISTTTYRPSDAASRALSLIPAYDTSLSYEHVQALVLLSLFYLRTDNQRMSWILIGYASRVNTGLDSSRPGRRPSSVSRRTSVACYTVERLIAASMDMKEQVICPHATPSQGEDWEIEAEGWEEWSTWEAFSEGRSSGNNNNNKIINKNNTSSNNNTKASNPSREPLRGLTTVNNAARLASVLRSSQSTASLDIRKALSDETQQDHPSLADWIHYAEANCAFLLPNHNGEQDNITTPHLFHLHGIIWAARASFHSHKHPLASEIPLNSSDRQEARAIVSKVLELAINYQKLHPILTAPLGLVTALDVSRHLVDKADELHGLVYKMWRATIRCSASVEGPSILTMPSLPIPGETHAPEVTSEPQEHGLTVNSSSHMIPDQHSSSWHVQTSSRGITTETMAPRQDLHAHAQGFDAQMSQVPARAFQDMGGVISMSMNPQPPENIIDPASLSARELTQLDAAVWRDDLFTKNLGFVEDPPMMESVDFGYGFDFLPEQ